MLAVASERSGLVCPYTCPASLASSENLKFPQPQMIPNLCTLNSNWMPRTLFPCHIPAQFFLDLGNPAKLSREAYPKCCLHCSHQLQLFAVSSLARSLCVSMLAEYWLSLHFQEGRKRVGGEEGREGGESGVSPFDS